MINKDEFEDAFKEAGAMSMCALGMLLTIGSVVYALWRIGGVEAIWIGGVMVMGFMFSNEGVRRMMKNKKFRDQVIDKSEE